VEGRARQRAELEGARGQDFAADGGWLTQRGVPLQCAGEIEDSLRSGRDARAPSEFGRPIRVPSSSVNQCG